DRGTVPAHWQDREWPGGHEVLDSDAAMVVFVTDRRYDTGLAVAPLCGADASALTQRRFLPVGRSHEATRKALPIGEDRDHRQRRGLYPVNGERGKEQQAWERAGTFDQSAAEHKVFDDIAERCTGLEFAMVVMQKQRRPIVGDPDLENRLGCCGDLRPQ